jgi:hypothetical protein
MYKPAMHPIIRLAFLVTPVLVAVGGTLKAQQPSSVRTNADSSLASVQLARLPTELPSGAASVREIATSVAEIQASVNAADDRLSKLATELDARVIEDTKFLSANPSIEILYRIKLSWRDFGDNLATSDRDLTQLATRLEEKADRLDRLAQTWQAMLQSATEQGAPSLALQSIRSLMSSIERAQNTAEASRQRLFTLRSRLSELETKVRDILSLVEEARVRALKDLLVRDSPPIWSVQTVLKCRIFCFPVGGIECFRQTAPLHLPHPRCFHRCNRQHSSMAAAQTPQLGQGQITFRARDAGSRPTNLNCLRAFYSVQRLNLSAGAAFVSGDSRDRGAYSGHTDSATTCGPEPSSNPLCTCDHVLR